MKALVTGGAGFVGSRIIAKLLEDPTAEVVCLDSLTDYYDPRIKMRNLASNVSRRLRVVVEDINRADLATLLDGVDVVFHQAGQPGVRKSWGTEFQTYTHCNVVATQALLEAARSAPNLKRFVYASSSSVYGDAESYPTSESHLPAPRSPYGVSKLAAEHLCSLYAANFGVPTVSLRYFTVYGPGQRPDMAFNRFITALLASQPITVYGDGEQVREFTYVDDIVRANLLAVEAEVKSGAVINLSGGSSVSVLDVLSALKEISGREPLLDFAPAVAGDVARTGGSTERAHSWLGWAPSVSLKDGLKNEFDWLRESGWAEDAYHTAQPVGIPA